MGSANQVPNSFAGYDARAIRRGVLVLAAELCTIISLVLLTRCSFSSGHMWVVGRVAGENRPNDPRCFVRHGDRGNTGRFALQQGC